MRIEAIDNRFYGYSGTTYLINDRGNDRAQRCARARGESIIIRREFAEREILSLKFSDAFSDDLFDWRLESIHVTRDSRANDRAEMLE